MLTPENAKLLEVKTLETLKKLHPNDEAAMALRQIIVRTVITTLHEYEEMLDDQKS